MGIGYGIVTKSAKRPKYRLDAIQPIRTHIVRRDKYFVLYRYTPSGNRVYGYQLKRYWGWRKDVGDICRMLGFTRWTAHHHEKEYNTFVFHLCNNIEGLPNPNLKTTKKLEAQLQEFLRLHPNWLPENNYIKPRRRLQWQ